MVIAVEPGHQGPDRGSSLGLYRPIKGHLMAGRQSEQGTLFLPARLGLLSWGPQPSCGVPFHPRPWVLHITPPHPLLPGRQHLSGVM